MKFSDKQQSKIDSAAKLLKEIGVKKLRLYNFGIYYQYEMAGQKITPYLLENEVDKLSEEDMDELLNLLSFTETKRFTDRLGFPDEGQNTLMFNDKGEFTYKKFSI